MRVARGLTVQAKLVQAQERRGGAMTAAAGVSWAELGERLRRQRQLEFHGRGRTERRGVGAWW